MHKNQGIIIREFNLERKTNAFMAYIKGMVDKQALDLTIIPQLMSRDAAIELSGVDEKFIIDSPCKNVLAVHNLVRLNKFSEATVEILRGQVFYSLRAVMRYRF